MKTTMKVLLAAVLTLAACGEVTPIDPSQDGERAKLPAPDAGTGGSQQEARDSSMGGTPGTGGIISTGGVTGRGGAGGTPCQLETNPDGGSLICVPL